MAQINGPAEGVYTNEEIIKRFNDALTQTTKAAADPTYDFERQVLIAQARLQWLMFRGQQNVGLGLSQNDYGGTQVDYVPFDYGSGQEETGADVRLCPNMNVLGGDGYKFMAVMGSSSPRVKAIADNLRSPEDIAAAHCADVNIRDLWIANKIDRKWKIPAFHLYVTGPCFIRGFWNTDKVKYGASKEPKLQIIQGPDGLPIPQQIGIQEYANGDAEISFHSVLEVSIPWQAQELAGHPLKLERMMSKWALLAKFPGVDGELGPLDQWRDGQVPDDEITGASVSAAEAKVAVTVPSSTAQGKRSNEWRFTEWWIPPHLFESIISPEARRVIKNQFQNGIYIARVGSITVELREVRVTDEWTVATVNRGETIMDRPICADNVPIQRAVNDLSGMALETILRAITQTIMDSQLIDRQAMSTKEAVPAEIILTALPVDGDISKRIYQIPPAHLSDQAIPLLDKFRALGQDISGIRPELSGGGAPTSTYREARQRKDQALGQLAPQSQSMRDAAADLARILVNLRCQYGTGTVTSTKRSAYGMVTDVADMEDLSECGWHPEADDEFPLTSSDRRDALFSILKEFSPDVQQALSVLDPLNIEETLELIQIPGFQSATADQKQKTLADIDKLLQQQPIPGAPGPDGQPGPPQPSISPDMFDDHQLVSMIVARWLVGPVGQKQAGTPGFLNVVAFWNAHFQLAQPPQPPPPPPVKGSMAISLKAEDVPSLIPGLLEAAGIPASVAQPPVPQPQPASPTTGSGPGTGGLPPIPPLHNGPQPPAPPQ